MGEMDGLAGSVGRLLASGLVAALGLGLGAAVAVVPYSTSLETPGWGLVLLGELLALALVVAGALLFRADFTPVQTLRVAGWGVLGTVVIGIVVGVIGLAGTPIYLHAAGALLSVGAIGGLLLGVRNVQRDGVTDLADQREQFAVRTSLVRRELRQESQELLFAAERLDRDDVPDHAVAETVERVARSLSGIDDTLARSQELVRGEASVEPLDLRELLVDLADRYRQEYPDASIELVLPETCRVESGDQLRIAIAEVLENALEHGGVAPKVTVDATNRPEGVLLEISDDGPGIPEASRAVIEQRAELDDLEDSQGLGLWYVRRVLDVYGGDVDFVVDEDGTTARMALPAAEGQ